MNNRFNLARFLDAQQGLVETVKDELAAGRKRTHWMWFFFPQLAGLGRSETARRYAIASLDEARAYFVHGVLGPRLSECAYLANASPVRSALELFGDPDVWKFHSCLTLFARAAPSAAIFHESLTRFFGGERDANTEAILREMETRP
jgi:uncharacterized protein (DUF1810 family)